MNWLKKSFNKIFIISCVLSLINVFSYAEVIEGGIRKEIKHTQKAEYKISEKEVKYSTAAILAYNKGIDYFKISEYDKSIESFKTAIKLEPRFADAYFNLGILYGYFNNPSNAVISFNRAYVINKKDYEALYYVIKSNIDNGDITAAKHYFNKLPKDSEFYTKAQTHF